MRCSPEGGPESALPRLPDPDAEDYGSGAMATQGGCGGGGADGELSQDANATLIMSPSLVFTLGGPTDTLYQSLSLFQRRCLMDTIAAMDRKADRDQPGAALPMLTSSASSAVNTGSSGAAMRRVALHMLGAVQLKYVEPKVRRRKLAVHMHECRARVCACDPTCMATARCRLTRRLLGCLFCCGRARPHTCVRGASMPLLHLGDAALLLLLLLLTMFARRLQVATRLFKRLFKLPAFLRLEGTWRFRVGGSADGPSFTSVVAKWVPFLQRMRVVPRHCRGVRGKLRVNAATEAVSPPGLHVAAPLCPFAVEPLPERTSAPAAAAAALLCVRAPGTLPSCCWRPTAARTWWTCSWRTCRYLPTTSTAEMLCGPT